MMEAPIVRPAQDMNELYPYYKSHLSVTHSVTVLRALYQEDCLPWDSVQNILVYWVMAPGLQSYVKLSVVMEKKIQWRID